jgi:hypothetical protein
VKFQQDFRDFKYALNVKESKEMISRLDVEVENDVLILEHIHSAVNVADHMTKLLDRTLFYRHVDHLMGHVPPVYSLQYLTQQ